MEAEPKGLTDDADFDTEIWQFAPAALRRKHCTFQMAGCGQAGAVTEGKTVGPS